MSRAGQGEELSSERVAEMVRSLAAVMCESDLAELDLEFGRVVLHLRRGSHGGPASSQPSLRPETIVPVHPGDPEYVISAPMIGTFYSSATPGSPSFIAEGDEIVTGQTIGIIEAMKIMNEIAADRGGTVAEILVENGQAVEYGLPLIRLSLGASGRS